VGWGGGGVEGSSSSIFGTKTSYSDILSKYDILPTYTTYEGGSKSFQPDQLFKVTEIKQLCFFSI